jgi:Xaa-Pro aminopeptidase
MRPPADLPSSEFQARVKRLAALQKRLRLDAALVFTDVNRYYFTGLETSNGLLLAQTGRPPVFLTDFRYIVMARKQAPWLSPRLLWKAADEQAALARTGRRWRRVGYEGAISAARFLKLKEALPGVEWVDLSQETAGLRAVKSPAEQRLVRAAVAANDRLCAELLRCVRPGMTEWEIRGIARLLADRFGHGEAFDTIACAGRNGAECHHQPDGTVLRPGRPLLLDLGLKLNRYCADMTRCVWLGGVRARKSRATSGRDATRGGPRPPGAAAEAVPPALWREVHKIVLAANRAAVRAIRPGVPCRDIDAVARRVIEKAGYGKFFGHSLGHGLGLEVHESPNFASSCKTPLRPGMVLTVEPGIYLPGRFGIRIEDVILVTRDGCEVLTQTPREYGNAIR